MQYEYLLVSYVQVKGGYRFYEYWNGEGVTIEDMDYILHVYNHWGSMGWEFISWENGKMLYKRVYGWKLVE